MQRALGQNLDSNDHGSRMNGLSSQVQTHVCLTCVSMSWCQMTGYSGKTND